MKKTNLCLLLTLLSACSSMQSSHWNPDKNTATRNYHRQVLDELEANFHRGPASVLSDINVDFRQLRKVRPGKFEVYLFPKISSQHHKEISADEEYLGPPQIFEVTILAVNPCQQFIKQGLFSKLNPQEAFPAQLANDANRYCSIMEIQDKHLARIDKGRLKTDDQLAVRLFLDDSYRIHAVDHTLFETRNKNRVVRRIVEDEALSSGLSLFPMDLPTRSASVKKAELGKYYSQKLDSVAVYQIQKRYARSFSVPRCEGAVFTEKDPLGGTTTLGWCRGIPWPTYSENRRFFSVTQPLRVR